MFERDLDTPFVGLLAAQRIRACPRAVQFICVVSDRQYQITPKYTPIRSNISLCPTGLRKARFSALLDCTPSEATCIEILLLVHSVKNSATGLRLRNSCARASRVGRGSLARIGSHASNSQQ